MTNHQQQAEALYKEWAEKNSRDFVTAKDYAIAFAAFCLERQERDEVANFVAVQERGMKILNEEDPFKREIWAMGYDIIEPLEVMGRDTLRLIRESDGYSKEVVMNYGVLTSLTVLSGVRMGGHVHRWLSDADGSCERFREMIKPDKP